MLDDQVEENVRRQEI